MFHVIGACKGTSLLEKFSQILKSVPYKNGALSFSLSLCQVSSDHFQLRYTGLAGSH